MDASYALSTFVAVDEIEAGEKHAVSARQQKRFNHLICELLVCDGFQLREQDVCELPRMALLLD